MSTERDHLDAETVAAWMDDGLDAASRAAAEAHASNCERCQMLLATTATTMPIRLKADTPDAQVVSGFSRIRWWLAPIAAATAAVTIWMVVPRQSEAPSAPPQESKVADARDAIVPPAPMPQTPPAAAPAPAPLEKPSAAEPARQGLADSGRAQTEARNAVASNEADARGKREGFLERADAAAPAPQATVAAAPPAAPSPRAAPERRSEPAALQGAATVAPLQKQAALAIEVVSPDPASRWRVAQGFIERSEDGGASWLPMRPVAPDEIRAGSSPSRLVCWLVGTRGLVLLATDGTNFTRLPFPIQIDLASVTATSAAAAAVTTADGRTLVTADSGRTWNPR